MTGRDEEVFFEGRPAGAPPGDSPGADVPPPPRRRGSALFARNPAIAVLALAVSTWLLWDLAPDVSYYFSEREPIDLGSPGAYHLELARENRLVQIRGELQKAVPVTHARTGDARTVGLVAGTNLVVDRPGRGGPPVFEGRLLPASKRADYAGAVRIMREKGAEMGESWLVLRDGERPRRSWPPVLGAAFLLLLVAINGRALLKALTE